MLAPAFWRIAREGANSDLNPRVAWHDPRTRCRATSQPPIRPWPSAPNEQMGAVDREHAIPGREWSHHRRHTGARHRRKGRRAQQSVARRARGGRSAGSGADKPGEVPGPRPCGVAGSCQRVKGAGVPPPRLVRYGLRQQRHPQPPDIRGSATPLRDIRRRTRGRPSVLQPPTGVREPHGPHDRLWLRPPW